MGYNNDQFYNPAGQVPGLYSQSKANPPFVYPDRTIRVIDSNGNLQSKQLKRGYIRSLPLNNGESPSKCNFQFNPAMLNQSVSQMTGVLDVMHQSPEALAVPLMGNSNFTFSLRFDRSMELNNPKNSPDVAVDLWADLDPSQVGVLRDIAALYAVIGQGVSEGQSAQNAIRILSQIATVEANSTIGGVSDAVNNAANTIADVAAAQMNIGNFVDRNIGNSAFLIPTPVRIVFSSLYMVDGYVTQSNVLYSKFNHAYVPMTAEVVLTVEAKYIGFARKDTAATYYLGELANATVRKDAQSAEARNSVITAATLQLTHMDMAVRNVSVLNSDPGWLVTRPVSNQSGFSADDPLGTMFDTGELASVSQKMDVAIYGPYASQGAAQAAASAPHQNDLIGVAHVLGSSAGKGFVAYNKDDLHLMMSTDLNKVQGVAFTLVNDFIIDPNDWVLVQFGGSVYVKPTSGTEVIGHFEQSAVSKYSDLNNWGTSRWAQISWPSVVAVPDTSSTTTSAPTFSVPADNASSSVAQTRPGSTSSVGRRPTPTNRPRPV